MLGNLVYCTGACCQFQTCTPAAASKMAQAPQCSRIPAHILGTEMPRATSFRPAGQVAAKGSGAAAQKACRASSPPCLVSFKTGHGMCHLAIDC